MAYLVGYSQSISISGTWAGNFVHHSPSSGSPRGTAIYLILEHKKDSVTGHSITIFEHNKITDTAVCVIEGSVKNQKVTISETVLVNMRSKDFTPCLQTMVLRIGTGRNSSRMRGQWVGERFTCGEGGIEINKMNE
jgi:hypothetical protein